MVDGSRLPSQKAEAFQKNFHMEVCQHINHMSSKFSHKTFGDEITFARDFVLFKLSGYTTFRAPTSNIPARRCR